MKACPLLDSTAVDQPLSETEEDDCGVKGKRKLCNSSRNQSCLKIQRGEANGYVQEEYPTMEEIQQNLKKLQCASCFIIIKRKRK